MTACQSSGNMLWNILSRRMPAAFEHDVQAAEGIARLLDHREAIVEFGDRAVICRRLAARRLDLIDDLLRRRSADTLAAASGAGIVDHDFRTMRGHQLGDLGPDPATGTGADCDPSFEHAHVPGPSGYYFVLRVVGASSGFVNPPRSCFGRRIQRRRPR